MTHNPIRPWRNIERRVSRQIRVGKVLVGGDAPISVQTMTNTLTTDVAATIEQIQRLFADHLANGGEAKVDDRGRIRIDDWEMGAEVQKAVADAWEIVTTENLSEISDFSGYKKEFLRLFGFGLEGVDYEAETNTERLLPSGS